MFLNFSKIDFKCPYCSKEYFDENDIYLKRCNKTLYGITKVKCECSESFGMTYDYTGQAVSFKINKGVNYIKF